MVLAVIAKEPVPGRVKTRLCPPLSPEGAAALAAAALADTLAAVAATPARRRLLILDGRPGPWLPAGFEVLAQRGGGLAERLAAAFVDGMAGGGGPMVLIGMDTPQVTPVLLGDASARLGDEATGRRAVLGPAPDGGYWLVGLSHADPAVFAGVPMSCDRTHAEQLRQLRRCRYTVHPTSMLRDVDTDADADAVARQVPGSRFARRLAELGELRVPVDAAARP